MKSARARIAIAATVLTLVIITIAAGTFFWLRQGKEWRSVRSRILPQFVQISHKDRIAIVTRPFSPDLDLAYVVDEPGRYTFVQKEKLMEWEITEEDLYTTALENLEELIEDTELTLSSATGEETGKYIIVETGDGYDAVRILSSKIRARAAAELGDTYIAAIPIRDFLIFWNPDFSLREEFLDQVKVEFEKEKVYNLTPNPFLVTPEGIQPLKMESTTF